MKYEFRNSPCTRVRQCDDVACLPPADIIKSLYDNGYKLYVDGKKISEAEAIALVPVEEAKEAKRGRKKAA